MKNLMTYGPRARVVTFNKLLSAVERRSKRDKSGTSDANVSRCPLFISNFRRKHIMETYVSFLRREGYGFYLDQTKLSRD